jgi:hypothetical protein
MILHTSDKNCKCGEPANFCIKGKWYCKKCCPIIFPEEK